MTLLDAYALVALIADEPGADEVEQLLRAGGCRIDPANLAETVDITQRVHGVGADELRTVLGPLIPDTLTPLTTGPDEAWMAGDLRARHYDKKTRALSLADCLLLAHAVIQTVEIATSDPPLAEAARAEGLGVVALPDTAGARP